jgi:hypothetical protein
MTTRQETFKGRLGTTRVYFYDLTTGEELAGSGGDWGANGGYAVHNGVAYTDSMLDIEVVNVKTRRFEQYSATSFPGRRVAIKIWYAATSQSEWFALVDTKKGWHGDNNVATSRKMIGVEQMAQKMPRKAA